MKILLGISGIALGIGMLMIFCLLGREFLGYFIIFIGWPVLGVGIITGGVAGMKRSRIGWLLCAANAAALAFAMTHAGHAS